MKLLRNGSNRLLQFFCLLATILCFSVAVDAQIVGSVGHTFGDWETEKVCYSLNGVDVTLTKFSRAGDGQTSSVIKATKFFDALDKEVFPDTINGDIVFGMCGGVDVATDSLQYFVKDVYLCDYDETRVDPYHSFIRSYLRKLNKTTGQVTTLGFEDSKYDGSAYTVSIGGVVGDGLCAASDTLDGVVDYEHIRVCMVDSIGVNNMVEFTRFWTFKNGEKSYLDVDDLFEPYPLVGAKQKKCQADAPFHIMTLCDKEFTTLAFSFDNDATPKYGFLEADLNITSTLDFINTVNSITVDCGQGQINTDRNVICECDYNNLPDGYYYPKYSVIFRSGGTRVISMGRVHLSDGNIISGNLASNFSHNVLTNSTPFIRKYNYDLTFSDYEIDGQTPYIATNPSQNCDQGTEDATDIMIPSTKPNLEVQIQECWKQDIVAGNYFDHEVVWDESNSFSVFGLRGTTGNSASIPLRENILELPRAEQYLIQDVSEFLVAQGHKFHSVTVEVKGANDYVFRINHLENDGDLSGFFIGTSFDAATNSGIGIPSTAIKSYTYSSDTTMMFDVIREQHSGRESGASDAYGLETYLPSSAYKVPCGGGVFVEDNCSDLLGNLRQFIFEDTLVNIPANTIFSYTITPLAGNPIIQLGTDDALDYPTVLSTNGALPNCRKVNNTISIDTRNGSKVFFKHIE